MRDSVFWFRSSAAGWRSAVGTPRTLFNRSTPDQPQPNLALAVPVQSLPPLALYIDSINSMHNINIVLVLDSQGPELCVHMGIA